MGLYTRGKSKTWWCDIQHPRTGERIRQSTRTTDRKLADEFVTNLKQQLYRESYLGDKPKHSWTDACKRWLEEKQHKRALHTDYQHLEWAWEYLGELDVHEIDREVLEKLKQAKLSTGVAHGTVNRMLRVIRGVLNACERDWGWLDKAPVVRELPETATRDLFLTRDQAAALLAELPPHLKAMAQFTLMTGLRRANVTGLTWDQVDMEGRKMWVYADQAKGKKAIGVSLNKDAMVLLRELKETSESDYVFTYKGKKIIQCSTAAWRKAKKRAGIPKEFRWHDLRHTWASWLAQAGVPLQAIQTMGGWSSFDMVLRYAHFASEHLADYAERLSTLEVVEIEPEEPVDVSVARLA